MLSNKEKKAIERIEDFLTTNIIISISSNETANSEELKAFISKNEYLSIEFISTLFLKQSKEIEELKDTNKKLYEMGKQNAIQELINNDYISKDKIKAKIEDILNSENSEAIEKLIEWQSLLEKE